MRFRFFLFNIIALSVFLFVGCSNDSKSNSEKLQNEQMGSIAESSSHDSTIVKVYVDKDGQIKANGKLVSIVELDALLHQVQPKAAIVYYSRYNAQAYEGPQASLKVLDVVIKYRLPLRFYTDSTFSEPAPMN